MKKINNNYILFSVIVVFFVKLSVMIFLLWGNNITLGGGTDTYYYDKFARGLYGVNVSGVNLWAVILKNLNNIGLYDRGIITGILFIIGSIGIPLIVFLLCSIINGNKNYLMLLYASIYPAIFFYSTDIYRDSLMIIIWLIGVAIVNKILVKRFLFVFLIAFFIISLLLFYFRSYLGFSFFVAFFMSFFMMKIKRWNYYLFVYLVLINIFFLVGFFEPLVHYRSGFESITSAGTSLGLNFSNINPFLFIPYFIVSYLFQFFGLYLVNMSTFFVFIFETVPVIIAIRYIMKNYIVDLYTSYLSSFIILYNTVWVIANDNLGTAVRLRIFSYLAIMILASYIFNKKCRDIK